MNIHKREMPITLGGKKYTMTPTLEACVQLEDELGRGLMDIMAELRKRNEQGGLMALKMREVASVLRWGVRGGTGTLLELDEALHLVWDERGKGRLPELCGSAMAFVMAAISVDDPERDWENDSSKK